MRHIQGIQSLSSPIEGAVLTLGNFDGVHLGHQMIVREVQALARQRHGTSVVLTFDPPPGRVLGKATSPQIATLSDRARWMAGLGIELFVLETFTPALAAMTAEQFVEQLLETYIRPKAIFIGYDFCFGRERRGDVHFLRSYYEPRGVDVYQLGPLTLGLPGGGEEIISSSNIRRLVLEGHVERAAAMLGRPHELHGSVVHGDARGRTLGFPTANIVPETELLPAHGVYAGFLRVGDARLPAVTNIGNRPTFSGATVTVESHVLDFQGDLYHQPVVLELVSRLRGEQKFSGLDALKAQIAQDVLQARRRLGLEEGAS